VPLVTILATIPMLGIWPTSRQLVGVLGGLVCMAGVVFDGSQRGIPLGVLALGLIVPFTYALGNTYIKWKLDHLHPLPLTVLFLGSGGLMLLPLWCWPNAQAAAGIGGPAQPYDWPLALVSISLLAIIGTGLTILLFIHLVKHQGPLFAGMVTYVIPVLALAWGQFDGEKLTTLQLAAMAGVLAMVALVQWGAVNNRDILPDPLLD
jgi:drug/metabolite transporter (DMT)-like permease